jgi:DNA-binding MarR family transcriptional regulator
VTEESRKEVNDRLSQSDLRALSSIFDLGPCTTRELEEHLGVRKSAVHKYVANLRADGLIQGEKGAEVVGHRPPFRFTITPEGLEVLEEHVRRRVNDGRTRLAQFAAARDDRGIRAHG